MPNAGLIVKLEPSPGTSRRRKTRVTRRDIAKIREEVKMDANRLIAEVFKRPALWNQRHVSYHNREVTNRVWMEISQIFKLPKAVLKAKWKGLRDTFRAELKKELVYGKSKCQRNRPLWIHFESLQFLKDQMVPRPPVWEYNNHNDSCSRSGYQNGMNGNNDEGIRNFDDSLSEHLLHSSIARSNQNTAQLDEDLKNGPEELLQYQNGLHVNGTDESEVMLQDISPEHVLLNANSDVNSQSAVNGENDSDSSIGVAPNYFNNQYDENYYFFISLLPHMKQLSAERRMFLRMKIQELVYKEVYKKSIVSSQENVSTS